MPKVKIKLGKGNYIDFGCRVICFCGHHEYFNKDHFVNNGWWCCEKCDKPLVVVNSGIPHYVGRPVFPVSEKWGSDL